MQSAKKSTKILSALSMAAGAVLATQAAHGATLTMYYGQDTYANSDNTIAVGTTFARAGNGTDLSGETAYLGGTITPVVVNPTGATTITLPVGDYLSLAFDAVLTGDANPDAGSTAGGEPAQPANLGLAAIGMGITSSDATATFLTPIGNTASKLGTFTNPATSVSSPTFKGFGIINSASQTIAAGHAQTGSGLKQNGGGGVVPEWDSINTPGDVQPNVTNYDPGAGNGTVGLNGFINGGNAQVNNTGAVGTGEVGQFGAAAASYATATDFSDSVMFQGLSAGTVTLTPYVQGSATAYWTLSQAGSGTSLPSGYSTHTMTAADTINQLPVLVIKIGTPVTGGHAIVSLAATASANANYGSTLGSLTITGNKTAGYTTAQLTGLSASTGNVNTSAWAATTDPEIYGVDVEVGGTQATPTQIAALIAAIDTGDGVAPASTGVVASATDPSGGDLSGLNGAGTTYNLFLDFAAGGPSIPLDNLGLDLSSSNDSLLAGYTFTAVSVVPEPMSLGLLALGGLGLMSRRNRRKA